MALKQKTMDFHKPADALVVGGRLAFGDEFPVHQGCDAPVLAPMQN
jgi:hypothetical protein